MSILTRGRHRGPSVGDLKDRINDLEQQLKAADQRECELTRLALDFAELGTAYKALEAQHAEANARAARLDGENIALRAQVRNLTAVSVPPAVRDTSAIEDQATEPVDVRGLRDEVGDDYLDRTRQSWIGPVTRVMPLFQSPLAAVVDPGQISDDTTVEIPVLRLPAAS